jgi:hypothetical protein
MRWCAALSLLLMVLLVATAKVAFREPRRVATETTHRDQQPVPLDEVSGAAGAPTAPPRPYQIDTPPRAAWHPARPAAGIRERTAVARVHGRVFPPPGVSGQGAFHFDGLEVSADDGLRAVTGKLSPGGHFSFHLPPGRYTLAAEIGDLAGARSDVLARPDEDSEIDVQLGPTASISGNLTGPDDAEVTLIASPVGGARAATPQSIGPGNFSIDGLIPGRRYDLTFSGPTIRKATLRSVVAPADGVEALVAALPIVRGAIGFLVDEPCPIETVSLRGPGIVGDDARTEVSDDCRFELTPPEGASDLVVIAEGPGWRLEESVSIPALGDPDPICLNPPCRPDSLEDSPPRRPGLVGRAIEMTVN